MAGNTNSAESETVEVKIICMFRFILQRYCKIQQAGGFSAVDRRTKK